MIMVMRLVVKLVDEDVGIRTLGSKNRQRAEDLGKGHVTVFGLEGKEEMEGAPPSPSAYKTKPSTSACSPAGAGQKRATPPPKPPPLPPPPPPPPPPHPTPLPAEEPSVIVIITTMSVIAESDWEEYCRFQEEEEGKDDEGGNRPPASWSMGKRRLSKQMSMKDTRRERAWMRRKRQVMMQRMEAEAVAGGSKSSLSALSSSRRSRRERSRDLTDEDLDELKGFMDLGFRFTEMDGCEDLRIVLPALDLLFAVKRQYSDSRLQYTPSPVSTPTTLGSQRSSPSPLCSPTSRSPKQCVAADSWKIVEPGDNPQLIKTKLRHWAQAVACSVRDLPTSS